MCTLPAAAALKNAFADCHITWVVDARFEAIVRACSAIDEVVLFRLGWRPKWPELAQPFDAALDLQGLLKSALPVALSRSHRKLGYHWQREGSWLFSQKVLPDPTSFHIVDQYVDVACAAGGVMDRAEFRLSPANGTSEAVQQKLRQQSIEKFVVMNPGGGWATKRWPIERFAKLADLLHEFGYAVILIGGFSQEESVAAKNFISLCKTDPRSWVGETSIADLIGLISLCEAHIGGDTGSTHIAAALGKPAIGLYSITNPKRSCPYAQFNNCLYNPESLTGIGVEQVLSKVMENVS